MQYSADQAAFAFGRCDDESGFIHCSEASPSEGSAHTALDLHQKVMNKCLLKLRLLDWWHCTCKCPLQMHQVKQLFPRDGSKATPPHPSADFKWKDYCPMAFRQLREVFNIDPGDYMLSICGTLCRAHLYCCQACGICRPARSHAESVPWVAYG